MGCTKITCLAKKGLDPFGLGPLGFLRDIQTMSKASLVSGCARCAWRRRLERDWLEAVWTVLQTRQRNWSAATMPDARSLSLTHISS